MPKRKIGLVIQGVLASKPNNSSNVNSDWNINIKKLLDNYSHLFSEIVLVTWKEEEKKVISKNATVGVYFWQKGKEYVKYAEQMIKKNIRVKNEFYICPVYNEAIKDKKKIIIDTVDKMWGLGTPEDLNNFLQNIR